MENRITRGLGTGKYKDLSETKEVIAASGAEIVTVAIRRMNIGQDNKSPTLDYRRNTQFQIQLDVITRKML